VTKKKTKKKVAKKAKDDGSKEIFLIVINGDWEDVSIHDSLEDVKAHIECFPESFDEDGVDMLVWHGRIKPTHEIVNLPSLEPIYNGT